MSHSRKAAVLVAAMVLVVATGCGVAGSVFGGSSVSATAPGSRLVGAESRRVGVRRVVGVGDGHLP